jgi:hypothetical protein
VDATAGISLTPNFVKVSTASARIRGHRAMSYNCIVAVSLSFSTA